MSFGSANTPPVKVPFVPVILLMRVHVAHADLCRLAPIGTRRKTVGFVVVLVRLQRNEIVETVAAVDVHVLADGAETMRRILVALVLDIPLQAPVVVISTLLGRLVAERPEVVDVRALAMHQLAKYPLAAEVEREHLAFAVAAVLELHAMAFRAFARLDERPAILEIHRRGHFDEDVLAVFHRLEGDRNMHVPAGRVVDHVDAAPSAHLAPFILGSAERLRRGLAVVLEPLLLGDDAILDEIAQGAHLHAGNVCQAVHRAAAAHAEAHDAHTHLFELRRGKALHRTARTHAHAAVCATCGHRRSAHPGDTLQKISAI